MTKFWATIEFLTGRNSAIITLTNNGEWAGSQVIDLPSSNRSALYELGYIRASQTAAWKGGQLDRYTEVS